MTYQLTTKNIKSITLRVDKNGIVKVSAPFRVSRKRIDNFVAQNMEWIKSKLHKIPKYADNEVVEYFGERYILQVRIAQKNSIAESQNLFGEKTLDITIKAQNTEQISQIQRLNPKAKINKFQSQQIKKLIFKWYRQKSQNLIDSTIARYKSAINREVVRISLREMSSKWGSCNYTKARITLNVALFARPQICFEYVLLHELIHLIHPNHGKGFYAMLNSLMPHWREVKALLR